MMRGAHHWAVAVRKPAGDVHVESHLIESVADRHPILRKPGLRGVIVLGPVARDRHPRLDGRRQPIPGGRGAAQLAPGRDRRWCWRWCCSSASSSSVPRCCSRGWRTGTGGGVPVLVGEGLFRVAIFVAYLWVIGRTKDIHRVFEYHGAEHKTIAAFEHGDPLDEPHLIDRYPKEHVRCGTNFLIIVMIITIFVFTLVRNARASGGGSGRGSSRSPSSPASRTRRCDWAPGSPIRW